MSFKRYTAPVSCDVAEEPVLDLVPFARPRRVMADFDNHAGLVCETLQFELPQTIAVSIAAAAVGSNQQPRRFAVAFLAQLFPPSSNRLDGELSRVPTDTH